MSVRKTYAPYSVSGENVAQTPLEGYIEVEQKIIPTIETGFVNEDGLWIGKPSSDTDFKFYQKDEGIANGGDFITAFGMDMTGFDDIQIAIRPTNGGAYAISAVMGSDGSQSYANLNPVNAAAILKGNLEGQTVSAINNLLVDSAEVLTADVWNIFMIQGVLANQKLLQFKLTNNSGGNSDVETTFLRIV